jgi:hypothetical protein
MDRKRDLRWYQANRKALANAHQGRWLVIFGQKVVKTFDHEEEAVEFSVTEFGINKASIFQAVFQDRFMFA